MKFKCGECKKYFTINNIHTINNDLEFQCDNCTNQFTINRNLAFSSSSKNSEVLCENCGKLIPEAKKVCEFCNLILNKTHEEFRIDNKDYESLEINANGAICNIHSGKKLSKRKSSMTLITVTALAITIALAGYFFLPIINTVQSQDSDRIETQIVIMQSGQTYYANKIVKDGVYLRITNKNGSTSKVLKSNILQISKAVIEE
jgi:DNA-directed RNA polymerase subunit RPC12/RpoP